MEGTLFIDIEKCKGCKSCEIACALEHSQAKILPLAIEEEPLPQSRVKVEAIDDLSAPLQCRHCEDAPCVTVCPTKALKKDGLEGPVLLNEDLCIGCKWCVLACPFGVISLKRDGKRVIKCDLCPGRENGPACVEACPTKAIQFLTVSQAGKRKRESALKELKQSLVAGKALK